MKRVLADTGVAAASLAMGLAFFGPFEAHTPWKLRLLRALVFLGVTTLVSWRAGRRWAMGWVVGVLGVGVSFHGWWTHSHGIGFFRPEPRERYYRLRGWPLDAP